MRIELWWPDKNLSQNARVHWAVHKDATANARGDAWAVTRRHFPRDEEDRWPRNPKLRFTYYPPDRRKRDAQNMPAMLKAYIDGIADALGVDDSTFECVFPSKFAEPVKGGKIVVEIE